MASTAAASERPNAVRLAGRGHRQRNPLRLGGAAGAPPFDGMSDLAFESASSRQTSRGRIRAFDAVVLVVLMLAIWQAIGSWTRWRCGFSAAADVAVSLRSRPHGNVLAACRRDIGGFPVGLRPLCADWPRARPDLRRAALRRRDRRAYLADSDTVPKVSASTVRSDAGHS